MKKKSARNAKSAKLKVQRDLLRTISVTDLKPVVGGAVCQFTSSD